MSTAGRCLALLLCLGVVLSGCQKNPTRAGAPSAPAPEAQIDKPPEDARDQTALEAAPHAAPPNRPTADPGPADAPPPPAPSKPKPIHKPNLAAKSAVYDRNGPAYSLLQSPGSALRDFPADAQGRIDWVAALQQGIIDPRASVSGKAPMRRRTDDIIMRNTREMPWVRFPHAQHTEWLDCSNCHPRPFKEKAGANEITMDTIMRGRHCGVCHDRVAFSIFACERCHSIMHEGAPAAWW